MWFCVSARLAFTNECLAFDHQRQQKHVEEDEEKFQDAKINLSLSLHSNWAERLWNKLLQRNPTIAKQFSPTHPDNQLAASWLASHSTSLTEQASVQANDLEMLKR